MASSTLCKPPQPIGVEVGADHDEPSPGRCERGGFVVLVAGGVSVEAGREPLVEFGEVLPHRPTRVGRPGVDQFELDGRRAQQPVGGSERRGELVLLTGRQRCDQSLGDLLRAVVELASFGPTPPREPHDALAPIGWIGRDHDQPLVLELAQQAADVTRVESQAAP